MKPIGNLHHILYHSEDKLFQYIDFTLIYNIIQKLKLERLLNVSGCIKNELIDI